ncbi:MAG: DNA mismatch endonuclease Vsr [Rhodospirillales bacterium]|nr:DNA mismatch endonuclease Vsr [Rhodospirillales bacterium]
MDTRTPQKRSEIMSLVRNKNTKPELAVRRIAFRRGFRYRLHRGDLPGRPDLVFPSKQKVIFVHGCFWHSHSQCSKARPPKSRKNYWLPKLRQNRQRDTRNRAELRKLGWASLVIWQCQLKNEAAVIRKIERFLDSK